MLFLDKMREGYYLKRDVSQGGGRRSRPRYVSIREK